jgi:hypothetical protein
MKAIFLLPVLLLVGCQYMPPKIVNHNVMVPVPCKVTLPVKPEMPLTDNGDVKDDIFVKTKKALAEIDRRKGYEAQLEAVVKSCE